MHEAADVVLYPLPPVANVVLDVLSQLRRVGYTTNWRYAGLLGECVISTKHDL